MAHIFLKKAETAKLFMVEVVSWCAISYHSLFTAPSPTVNTKSFAKLHQIIKIT